MRRREVLELLAQIERREDALREEIDKRHAQRFADQQRAVDAALAAQEKATSAALADAQRAVLKAESAAERRFEGVNEFRQTLSDQATHLMPRAEVQIELASLRGKIADLVNLQQTLIAGLTEKIVGVESGLARFRDREAGMGLSAKIVTGVASFVAVMIGIYFALHK